MTDDKRFLFTCQDGAGPYSLSELNGTSIKWQWQGWLDNGCALIRGDFEAFSRYFQKHMPIFIRHICPVQAECELPGDMRDVDILAHAAEELPAVSGTFSVQSRFLFDSKRPYRPYHVHKALGDVLSRSGAVLSVQNPEWVLSVAITPKKAYLGLSKTAQNLSDWPGGACRFAFEEGQISRAEFKLLEAFRVFPIQLPPEGDALDLGAAPGGWTRVLRQRGLRVAAVDPAQLHPSLLADPMVKHYRMLTQQFLHQGLQFDLIVNDMRMDSMQSADLTLEAASALKSGAYAIMTLKLPEKNQQRIAQKTLEHLSSGYRIVGAKQLFHNRSEVTAVLQKP